MRINLQPPTDWRDLQTQVAKILYECGMTAEVEKTITTVRGTVNVDVYAIDEKQMPSPVCLCECKYWSTPVSKDIVHSFRTVLSDFGANWGFLVSKEGFQSGAVEAAQHTNIKLMTWDQFELVWMDRWIENYLRPTLYAAHESIDKYTEPVIFIGDRIDREVDALPDHIREERKQQFLQLRTDPLNLLPSILSMRYGAPWHKMMPDAEIKLPMGNRLNEKPLPPEIEPLRTITSLREFGDTLCKLIADGKARFDRVFTV